MFQLKEVKIRTFGVCTAGVQGNLIQELVKQMTRPLVHPLIFFQCGPPVEFLVSVFRVGFLTDPDLDKRGQI
jgi:hypothetical protein